MLRGFGKNYFTLSAILAYSVAHKLQAQVTSAQTLLRLVEKKENLDENDSPDFLLQDNSLLLEPKPCHCNCYFKLRTRLALLLNHYIPRCPFYCTYFAFRRSGVHPPKLLYLF